MTPPTMSEDDRLRAEWRTDVTRDLERSAQAHQQTAVILERLSNHFDDLERRVTTLEARPERQRAAITQVGGLWTQIAYVTLALAAILISAASHISFH